MPEAKPRRTETLYVRVQPINKEFVVSEHKAKNYRSESEYVDTYLTELREKMGWKPSRAAAGKKEVVVKKAAKARGKKMTAAKSRKAATKSKKTRVPAGMLKARKNARHQTTVRKSH